MRGSSKRDASHASAPHPSPLPVKDGQREQVEHRINASFALIV